MRYPRCPQVLVRCMRRVLPSASRWKCWIVIVFILSGARALKLSGAKAPRAGSQGKLSNINLFTFEGCRLSILADAKPAPAERELWVLPELQ
jgi:hypothetical protein